MPGQEPVATHQFSDYTPWPDLTETAVQDVIPTESYGNFGLEVNPAAGAFFDTLAQFYRNGYLRYINATKRRPDLRAARIAEVTGLLASGIKERPRY
jgi:hypothetical protein